MVTARADDLLDTLSGSLNFITFLFFFSSRRRHTRYWRDWSSDVCSSDLIPYNPTRVIQRIGRINRINKKVFDNLYIYNYFPTEIGESETRTKEISTLKMAMIHAIMGEDTKALTSDEECTAFFRDRYRAEIEHSETESWDTPYRRFLE